MNSFSKASLVLTMTLSALTARSQNLEKQMILECDASTRIKNLQVYKIPAENNLDLAMQINGAGEYVKATMNSEDKILTYQGDSNALTVDLKRPARRGALFVPPTGTVGSIQGVILTNAELAEIEEVRLTGYSHQRYHSTLFLKGAKENLVCSLLTPKTYHEAISQIVGPAVLPEVVVTAKIKHKCPKKIYFEPITSVVYDKNATVLTKNDLLPLFLKKGYDNVVSSRDQANLVVAIQTETTTYKYGIRSSVKAIITDKSNKVTARADDDLMQRNVDMGPDSAPATFISVQNQVEIVAEGAIEKIPSCKDLH